MTESTDKKLPVLGILSTIFGAISLIPMAGVISPVGLILGIIGLFKDATKVMAIIGTSLSVVGVLTSPILWGLIACAIDPEGCKEEVSEFESGYESSMEESDIDGSVEIDMEEIQKQLDKATAEAERAMEEVEKVIEDHESQP